MTEDKKSEDEWVMSGPTEKKVSDFLIGDSLEDEIFNESEQLDTSLESELENWGMELPPFLMDENNHETQIIDFPEVISDEIDVHFENNKFEDYADSGFENDLNENPETLYGSKESNQSNEDQTKPSILDHLGKNFFSDEIESTSEHTLDDLVKDVEYSQNTGEFKGDLLELSSALSGMDQKAQQETSSEEEVFPEEDDLEYPDLSDFNLGKKSDDEVLLPNNDDLAYPGEEKIEAPQTYGPGSKLISEDDLISTHYETETLDVTDPSFNITQEMKTDLAKELENDDVDPDDFWATDDFPKIKQTLDKPITEVQASKQIKEDFFKELDEDDNFKIIPSKRFSSITLDEVAPPSAFRKNTTELDAEMEERIIEKVKYALTPAIEKIVKDLFSEKIEKVAWEVIPDLAENIIKHEVEEIAKQVYLSKDLTDKK